MAEGTRAVLSPGEAWVFGGLLAGKKIDLQRADMRPRWRDLARRLAGYPMLIRAIGWNSLTADLPDRDEVLAAVAKAEPDGPRPDDTAWRRDEAAMSETAPREFAASAGRLARDEGEG